MRTSLTLSAILLCVPVPGTGEQPTGTDIISKNKNSSLTAPFTPDEIALLIQELSDPSYAARTYATRRLFVIGMEASDPLQQAAHSDDAETALRAREMIHTLNQLYFTGVEVSLSFTKHKIAWDESIDLKITMINRSSHPARIPFDREVTTPHAQNSHARQVAGMLDAAEWLHVRHPGNREVVLRVDDYTTEPAIVDVVHNRLDQGPFVIIKPGQRITVTARAFNRGWARYPLLDAGEYTVTLDYTPEWDDEVLLTAQVGRVTSREVKITVVTPAPEAVSRTGQVASLSIEKKDMNFIARLTNRTDQPMTVNTNFGDQPPFAQGRWVYQISEKQRDHRLNDQPHASWHDFKKNKLLQVQPGQSVELSKISINDLRQHFIKAGADLQAKGWRLYFSYTNLCDRRWQQRQKGILQNNPNAPDFLLKPLPSRLLSARHTSNELIVPLGN